MGNAPLIMKRRVLAAKIEAVPGVAEALGAADGTFNVFDATISPTIDTVTRDGQGASFSKLPSSPGARSGVVTFKVELTGSGSIGAPVPSWASTFLPACGMYDDSDTFRFDSRPPEADGSNTETLTIGLYEDGVFKSIRGAQGTFVTTFASGERVMIEFTFTGAWDEPEDVALLAPDYPSVLPPRFANSDLNIGGDFLAKLSELTIDIGNDVQLRPDSRDITGYCGAVIVDREVGGTMDPEATTVEDHDTYGDWIRRTIVALSLHVGSGSADGNNIAFTSATFQIVGADESDRNGIQTDDTEFKLLRSADAGDDELIITFT